MRNDTAPENSTATGTPDLASQFAILPPHLRKSRARTPEQALVAYLQRPHGRLKPADMQWLKDAVKAERAAASLDFNGSCIYFIQAGDQAIKIGVSDKAATRARALQTAHHEELTVVGLIPGDRKVEAAWHRRFAHLRIRGEWFRAAPDLLAAIAKAVASVKLPAYTQLCQVVPE